MFNMTPELDRRIRDYAEQRGWSVGAAIRYFIEDGLDGEARRDTLARTATSRWTAEYTAKVTEEFLHGR